LLFVPALAWSQADAPAVAPVAPAASSTADLQAQVSDLQKKLDERKATIEDLTMKVAQLEKDSFDLVSGDFQPVAKKMLRSVLMKRSQRMKTVSKNCSKIRRS